MKTKFYTCDLGTGRGWTDFDQLNPDNTLAFEVDSDERLIDDFQSGILGIIVSQLPDAPEGYLRCRPPTEENHREFEWIFYNFSQNSEDWDYAYYPKDYCGAGKYPYLIWARKPKEKTVEQIARETCPEGYRFLGLGGPETEAQVWSQAEVQVFYTDNPECGWYKPYWEVRGNGDEIFYDVKEKPKFNPEPGTLWLREASGRVYRLDEQDGKYRLNRTEGGAGWRRHWAYCPAAAFDGKEAGFTQIIRKETT
jgi:hypothetical protein